MAILSLHVILSERVIYVDSCTGIGLQWSSYDDV
jgi:hypothetical protein